MTIRRTDGGLTRRSRSPASDVAFIGRCRSGNDRRHSVNSTDPGSLTAFRRLKVKICIARRVTLRIRCSIPELPDGVAGYRAAWAWRYEGRRDLCRGMLCGPDSARPTPPTGSAFMMLTTCGERRLWVIGNCKSTRSRNRSDTWTCVFGESAGTAFEASFQCCHGLPALQAPLAHHFRLGLRRGGDRRFWLPA